MIDDQEGLRALDELHALNAQMTLIAQRIGAVAETVITRDEICKRLDRLERKLDNVMDHLPGLES